MVTLPSVESSMFAVGVLILLFVPVAGEHYSASAFDPRTAAGIGEQLLANGWQTSDLHRLGGMCGPGQPPASSKQSTVAP